MKLLNINLIYLIMISLTIGCSKSDKNNTHKNHNESSHTELAEYHCSG